MGNGVTPDTDTESSLPTVGVVAALRELVEEIEEVLSARANGAKGGGLDECTGGLNGRFWQEKQGKGRTDRREVKYQKSRGLSFWSCFGSVSWIWFHEY